MLVHTAQLAVADLRKLGAVLLVIGLISGILGAAQAAGDQSGSLYLYRVSHLGVSVGLFANRNHQAVFLALLVPLALVWFRRYPLRMRLDQKREDRIDLTNAAVVVLICALFPLVLASGSRSGFAISLFSVVVSLIVLPPFRGRSDAKPQSRRGRLVMWAVIALLGGLSLTALALRNDRALSIDRLVSLDPTADMRSRILPTVLTMVRDYAPFGSGIGTFQPVYQIHEPDVLLSPKYANHVHNDWLEVAITAGVPGMMLLVWSVLAWLAGAWLCARPATRRERPEHELAIAGLTVILLAGAASITDYPLRTPGFSAVFALMLVWINLGLSKHGSYRTNTDRALKAGDAGLGAM